MNRNDDIHRLISAVTAHRNAGNIDDLILPWRQLAAQIGPLIGEAGFLALFGRAVRLLLSQYDWLAQDAAPKTLDGLLADLEAKYSTADPNVAVEANIALLMTYGNLLSGLVGSAMTIRLLRSAWPDESGQGNTKEQR